jgi:hypothetical protein
MTDWLHSVRTDGLPLHCTCIALHCIVLLHCIVVLCIALHYIALHCIALHCIAAYWLNVMLIVRHVCSWIVPSVTFNVLPPIGSVCLFVVFVRQLFFGSGPPYGRTDLLLYATELKLNWNNWNLSVHPWHSYTDILHWYFHFSEGKWLHSSVRPYIQISI